MHCPHVMWRWKGQDKTRTTAYFNQTAFAWMIIVDKTGKEIWIIGFKRNPPWGKAAALVFWTVDWFGFCVFKSRWLSHMDIICGAAQEWGQMHTRPRTGFLEQAETLVSASHIMPLLLWLPDSPACLRCVSFFPSTACPEAWRSSFRETTTDP